MRGFLARFETRLILTYLIIIVVVIGVVGLFVVRPLGEVARNQIARGLEAQARLIAPGVGPRLDAPSRLQELVQKFRSQIEARVTIIDQTGKVVAESDRRPESMESHADRPEVQTALAGKTGVSVRRSVSVGRDLLYVAIPLQTTEGIAGVVRVALPLEEIEGAMSSIQRTVAFAIAGALGVSILLSIWMARRVSRPVTTMVRAAHEMAGGDLSRRVAIPNEEELATLARAFNTMAEHLQDKMQDLEREQATRVSILESMAEGLIAVDRQGRILLMNASARRIFHLAPGTGEGKHLLEVIRRPDLLALIEECDRSQETTVFRRELALGSPPMILMVEAVPFRKGMERSGILMVLHDVTELRHLERVRQEFVTNVSHELRTPLTAIRGYVETLLEEAVEEPKRARPFLDVVARHGERMSRLIDDLLDLSNIEGGRIHLERVPVHLAEVAEQVCALYQEAAAKKGITLHLEVPEDLPAVWADRDRLQQILINLVDNATKFTSTGQVKLFARRVHRDFVEIVVSDTGTGIPSTDLPRITERFYRVDQARSRELGGTGLGLSIVKHLVHAHGGDLHIDSELGRGTRVTFILPIAA